MIQALKQNPDTQLYVKLKKYNWYRWFRIIIFEMIATILLTYGSMCSMYVKTPYPTPSNYQPVLNPGHSIFVSCAMFLALCFSGQLTGGHCNPSVTSTLLVSKGNKITIKVAFVYIFAQLLGAIIGGLIAWAVIDNFTVPQPQNTSAISYVKTFFAELVGTFIFCLFILIIVNEKTTFLKSNFWNYLLVPLMYFITRELTQQIDGLNPATTLIYQLIFGLRYGNWYPISTYYLYILGSIIGALISGVFFNTFYLPLFTRWKAKK